MRAAHALLAAEDVPAALHEARDAELARGVRGRVRRVPHLLLREQRGERGQADRARRVCAVSAMQGVYAGADAPCSAGRSASVSFGRPAMNSFQRLRVGAWVAVGHGTA
jgi:hypothetical protein